MVFFSRSLRRFFNSLFRQRPRSSVEYRGSLSLRRYVHPSVRLSVLPRPLKSLLRHPQRRAQALQRLAQAPQRLAQAISRMDGWVDGWMDGRTDGQMGEWMDGWNFPLVFYKTLSPIGSAALPTSSFSTIANGRARVPLTS